MKIPNSTIRSLEETEALDMFGIFDKLNRDMF